MLATCLDNSIRHIWYKSALLNEIWIAGFEWYDWDMQHRKISTVYEYLIIKILCDQMGLLEGTGQGRGRKIVRKNWTKFTNWAPLSVEFLMANSTFSIRILFHARIIKAPNYLQEAFQIHKSQNYRFNFPETHKVWKFIERIENGIPNLTVWIQDSFQTMSFPLERAVLLDVHGSPTQRFNGGLWSEQVVHTSQRLLRRISRQQRRVQRLYHAASSFRNMWVFSSTLMWQQV